MQFWFLVEKMMPKKTTIRSIARKITFADTREQAVGPIQCQVLFVAVFFLPIGIKCGYLLGFPKPNSWWGRAAVLLFGLAVLLFLYRAICRLIGIPTLKADKHCD